MGTFIRDYATPLSFVTFAATAVTGIMLFLHLGGGPLSGVHEWIGLLFVAAMILHLVRNGRGVLAMLSPIRNKVLVSCLGAMALVLIVLPYFGHGAGGGHGGGPGRIVVQRLADAPIAKLAPALGITGQEAIARLNQGGVAVDGQDQSLAEVASKQHVRVHDLMELVLKEPDA